MDPASNTKIALWTALVEMARSHSKANPLGEGKCDPSNPEWTQWSEHQKELERMVFNANPHKR
jgi:hypothetical protein